MEYVNDKFCCPCGCTRFAITPWGPLCSWCDDKTDYVEVGGCIVIDEEEKDEKDFNKIRRFFRKWI